MYLRMDLDFLGIPAGVHFPGGPWCLSLGDLLMTRLLDLIVHGDDLAVSVGAQAALPERAASTVLGSANPALRTKVRH